MNKELYNEVVDAVVDDIVMHLPQEVYGFFSDLPGRRPSEHSKRVASTIKQIDEQSALELISDVVDRAILSMLTLVDTNFKSRSIKISLEKGISDRAEDVPSLAERYRLRVDPGGVVV